MLKRIVKLFVPALLLALAACSTTGESETILVGGATGRQGGAVVDELLARGYQVRALVRKPEGKDAQALRDKGVAVVAGNYDDTASLLAAMSGIERMFFYSGFSMNEAAEGKNVIAAAKTSGLVQVVYSSGAAAEPGVGLASPKMEVEEALVASGVPYTVFRPVAFMENFDRQQARVASTGITDSRGPERELHFISIPDIGFLVGEAFDDPGRWLGVAINIASDKMTVAEYVDTYSESLVLRSRLHKCRLMNISIRCPNRCGRCFAGMTKWGIPLMSMHCERTTRS